MSGEKARLCSESCADPNCKEGKKDCLWPLPVLEGAVMTKDGASVVLVIACPECGHMHMQEVFACKEKDS